MTEEIYTGSSLGQQAFTVFCDLNARDAVAKNNQFRDENKSLQALERGLYSIEIFKWQQSQNGMDSLTVFKPNFHAFDKTEGEDGKTNLEYTCSDRVEFPLNDLPRLCFRVSDVGLSTVWFGVQPQLWIDEDGIVRIQVNISKDICIKGMVENYGGTLENIEEIIESNRVALHFMSMGMVNAETGLPSRSRLSRTGENYLENAIFVLTKLAIAESIVSVPLGLAAVDMSGASVVEEDDEAVAELCCVMPDHKELRCAAKDRIALRAENKRLLKLRDAFESFNIVTPEGNFNMKLRKGHGGTTFKGGHNAWILEAGSSEAAAAVPVSSIILIRMMISGIQVSFPHGPLFVEQPSFTGDGLMILQYGGGIEAVFSFNDTLTDEVINSLDDGLLSHVRATLMRSRLTRGGRVIRHLPELTMNLLWVGIRLDTGATKKRLELLGIDTVDVAETWTNAEQADNADEGAEEEGDADAEVEN